jgi:PBP1b-binding outer membrane lipoprotein LpoB
MRTFVITLAALFIAGCATAPANTTAVYDHKYNTYSFVKKSSQEDFVGTSAAAGKATPSWAPANTTAVYDHKYNTYSYVPK